MLPNTFFFQAAEETFNDGISFGCINHGSCVMDVEASEFISKDLCPIMTAIVTSKLQVFDGALAGVSTQAYTARFA